MTEKITFYKNAEAPRKWYPYDVFYWMGLQVFPESYYPHDDVEGRESNDYFAENMFATEPPFSDVYFEPHESKRAGLPLDPRWEDFIRLEKGGESYPSVTTCKKLLNYDFGHSPEEALKHKLEYEALIIEAEKFESKVKSWNQSLNDLLDPFKAQLMLDLRNGMIRAEGLFFNEEYHEEREDELADKFYTKVIGQREFESGFKSIPASLWITRRVDWNRGLVRGDDCFYLGIRFVGDEILAQYPAASEGKVTMHTCGNGFFSIGERNQASSHKSNRGRPQKNWDRIHMKIAELVSRDGGLPKKQDALAAEISDWYREAFTDDIGLTTIKAKLKPYYDNPNIQKSEK